MNKLNEPVLLDTIAYINNTKTTKLFSPYAIPTALVSGGKYSLLIDAE